MQLTLLCLSEKICSCVWSARCCRPLPPWEFKDYLGWMEQGDGRLAYGVFVANGRLSGDLKQARAGGSNQSPTSISHVCMFLHASLSTMEQNARWHRV